MTTDQMRIAVAESMGWLDIGQRVKCQSGKHLLSSESYLGGIPPFPSKDIDWEIHSEPVPNFPADLNAIREAALTLGWIHGGSYAVELRRIVMRDQKPEMVNPDTGMVSDLYFYEATAAQRCEAYLRVKGLWKEDAK